MTIKKIHIKIIFLILFLIRGLNSIAQDTTSKDSTDFTFIMPESSILFNRQPELNFISHSPDENDYTLYTSHSHLVNQLPNEKNHKKYYELATALWNINKVPLSEKMFLNILNSKIKPYNSPGIPGDTLNYKNSACIYLAKICVEQKKFQKALYYLDMAVKKYKVTYSYGTAYIHEQDEYNFLYATCYEGLGMYKKVVELLLPGCLNWDSPMLIRSIKKIYTEKEIKKYLVYAERSLRCSVESFQSTSKVVYDNVQKDEKKDTMRYYAGARTMILFGMKITLPYPSLEETEQLTKNYYLRCFRKSSFYESLDNKKNSNVER
jgi:tetratricopeptide (TPR) repeat protein